MFKVQQRRWEQMTGTGKFIVGAIVGASLSCALAAAAQVFPHDGAFWRRLGEQDKAAYVAGYTDAAHVSLSKFDNLKHAAAVLHWKGATKILPQVERGLNVPDAPAPALISYLDSIYSNPRYGDFDVGNAIGLAAIRGIGAKAAPSEAPLPRAPGPDLKR